MVSFMLQETRDYCCERRKQPPRVLSGRSVSIRQSLESTSWFTNFTSLVSVGSYSLSYSKIAPVVYSDVDFSRNPSRLNRAPGRTAYVHHSFTSST
ncbi:hypothetical protein DPMN_091764 [Dreissena polymorpha]|uniref:Uncharacterized protein n=1 Tax=Dreissena polymorpha TaxID=45954 RepID=A0A9D4L040_DREPO|nr:hypothetical protein DPMN_091764 [Dreissena polymorpha]